MTKIEQMFKTHPMHGSIDSKKMIECLEACMECAETCVSCADACLSEKNADQLKRCIRLNEDCNDICKATASILSRQTETAWALVHEQLQCTATACRLCAEECEKHAKMYEHCKVCAEVCHRCTSICQQFMQTLSIAA